MRIAADRFASRACLAAALIPAGAARVGSAAGPEAPRFSIQASIGRLDGRAREIVYDPVLAPRASSPSAGAERDKLSELTWDLSGLAVLRLGAALRTARGAVLSLDYRTALNRGDGELQNYDWLGPGEEWTDWSRSEVFVEAARMADVRAALPVFSAGRSPAWRAIAGYRRDFWKWSDRGWEYVYSNEGFRDTRGSFGGLRLVDYQQTFSIPYAGAGLRAGRGAFGCDAALLLSPLVTAVDRDFHRLRDTHFEERFTRGRYAAAEAAAAWAVRRNLRLTVALEARIIPETVGDMTIVEMNLTLPDAAGIAHRSLMAAAGMEWVF
ncbi:MAG: omptin family outer membrane protease [Lentisphaerae bacterium]|nr:omptin family outer membrane protease [Lentisphaerota bacterium]